MNLPFNKPGFPCRGTARDGCGSKDASAMICRNHRNQYCSYHETASSAFRIPSAPPQLSPDMQWLHSTLRNSSERAATGMPAFDEAGGSENTTPPVVSTRDQVTGAGRKDPSRHLIGQRSRMDEHGKNQGWKKGWWSFHRTRPETIAGATNTGPCIVFVNDRVCSLA